MAVYSVAKGTTAEAKLVEAQSAPEPGAAPAGPAPTPNKTTTAAPSRRLAARRPRRVHGAGVHFGV
ncbi:MAG: hypothetical protein ACRDLT_09345 [Solirubrobacteraceae bacterium]